MVKRIVLIVLVLAILGGLLVYSQLRPVQTKVSGFIEAHEIRLGSRVGGRVEKIRVDEGSVVKAGQSLVELAPFDLQELRSQAQAQWAGRKADLQKLLAGFRPEEIAQAKAKRDELQAKVSELVAGPRKETIAAAKARLVQAKAEEVYARASFQKMDKSFAAGVATREELDKATQNLNVTLALVQMRQQELDELQAGTRAEDIDMAKAQLAQAEQAYLLLKNGPRAEDIEAAKAAAAAAEAALKVIDAQLAELVILAPVDGVLEAFDLRPGDLVAPGAPAMSMLDPKILWVRAYVPEDLAGVRVGQRVAVTVDSVPGRRFAGRITFVARQAEFTPSNVQTPEKRSEQVFRIKVTLEEGHDVLRPGMSADVWLGGAAP